MATMIYRPWITFVFGMIVTCITLSVSVSLTLLVPLTARGIVRRENLIPYILGANITTFVDTIIASSVLKSPSGFTAVFCAAFSVALISVPIVFLGYRPYERLVDGLTRRVAHTHTRLILFVALMFSIALCLIWS
jgi:Na+/phosphate symporter